MWNATNTPGICSVSADNVDAFNQYEALDAHTDETPPFHDGIHQGRIDRQDAKEPLEGRTKDIESNTNKIRRLTTTYGDEIERLFTIRQPS